MRLWYRNLYKLHPTGWKKGQNHVSEVFIAQYLRNTKNGQITKELKMYKKKIKKYENAKISKILQYYAMQCLENMDTGMTLTITIHDNEQIVITYWKE